MIADVPVGLNKSFNSPIDIAAYPNPSKGDVTVQINAEEEGKYAISLYDFKGYQLFNTVGYCSGNSGS